MQGEINEADIQRAESNGVVGGRGEGEEKEKLGPGTLLVPVSYLLSSEQSLGV